MPTHVAAKKSRSHAKKASLRYISDQQAGYRRRRRGKGFVYLDTQGHVIRNPVTLARIRSLAIPPAYRDVWICANPSGHLQSTGFDKRGRKQYRYHPDWRAVRDEDKFDRMIAFATALPRIRRKVRSALAQRDLSRTTVLATIVQLLERTCIRVGNDEYAKQNGSYGLTTLRNRHASIRGSRVQFKFRGKGQKFHAIAIDDARMARIVRRCRELPGQDLFEYLDAEGRAHDVNSTDVNRYVQEITGQEFTAKDFRTWAATKMALSLLGAVPRSNPKERQKVLTQTIESVAQALGNTPAICRKSYVHPVVMECFLEGSLGRFMRNGSKSSRGSFSKDESCLIAVLKAHRRRAKNS